MQATPSRIVVNPSPAALNDADRAERMRSLSFGRAFTDHMCVIPYRDGAWQQGEIKAYGPLMLDPSCSSLHYGQAIFEGLRPSRNLTAALPPSARRPTRPASTAAPPAWPCPTCRRRCSSRPPTP